MKQVLSAALISLTILAVPLKCGPNGVNPGGGANGAINTDDGKHYISAVGKWKYSTIVAPSAAYVSTCHWEIYGLQKDGWQRLYSGKGMGKVELPPDGVYTSTYLESTSCGKWHKSKR